MKLLINSFLTKSSDMSMNELYIDLFYSLFEQKNNVFLFFSCEGQKFINKTLRDIVLFEETDNEDFKAKIDVKKVCISNNNKSNNKKNDKDKHDKDNKRIKSVKKIQIVSCRMKILSVIEKTIKISNVIKSYYRDDETLQLLFNVIFIIFN